MLELTDGETLPLVQEGGVWRIDAPPLEAWPRRTPRAALRSFVRALDQRRYDVLWRFAQRATASVLTAEKLRQMWEGEAQDRESEAASRAARQPERLHRRAR